MTGEALAFKIGGSTTQSSISHYERGVKKPECTTVFLLAQALGVDPMEGLKALMSDTPGLDVESLIGRYGFMSPETVEMVQLLGLFPPEERRVMVENIKRMADVRGFAHGKESEVGH